MRQGLGKPLYTTLSDTQLDILGKSNPFDTDNFLDLGTDISGSNYYNKMLDDNIRHNQDNAAATIAAGHAG